MLQAFIDDTGSNSQSRMFILAGFVATVPQWETFSDDWQRVLDNYPKIEYYNNNEAYGLKGQFAGWTAQQRDNKVVELARVISAVIPERFHVSVNNRDYTKYIVDIPSKNRFTAADNPYFMLFYVMILHIIGFNIALGVREKCDFVFDEQGRKWQKGSRLVGSDEVPSQNRSEVRLRVIFW